MSAQPASNAANDSTGKAFLPWWGVVLGFVLVVLLAVIPLAIHRDSEFGGADGAGADAITEIAPDYDAEWIAPWWEPPGGETESLLFALQAAAGAGVIFYALGYFHGRRQTSAPSERK